MAIYIRIMTKKLQLSHNNNFATQIRQFIIVWQYVFHIVGPHRINF